jgi:DNA-binding Lrp family transcriptional regulator
MPRLDKVDFQLLLALCRGPHSSSVGLAHALGISRNTVQARMARLEGSDVFRAFDRRISPAVLGYPLTAFITVHIEQNRAAEIIADLSLIPEIVQAHGVSGPADLLVRVACTDAEDLFRIDRAISACAGVQRTETSLAMGELIPYRVVPLLEQGVPPRSV